MDDVLDWVELLTGYGPVELVISGLAHCMEAMMAETAYVVHRSTGRVRLRIPSRRHDRDYFQDVRDRLSQCQGVQRVDVNPATGSVLIRYTGDLSGLIMFAVRSGLSELADIQVGLPPVEPVADRLRGRLTTVSSAISRTTGGTVDGGSAVLLSLLIAGLIQVIRGEIFGPAVPLLWYGAQAITGVLPNRSESN